MVSTSIEKAYGDTHVVLTKHTWLIINVGLNIAPRFVFCMYHSEWLHGSWLKQPGLNELVSKDEYRYED